MATSIQLSDESERRIDTLASQTGRTRDFYLSEIIQRGLEDVEDYYLAADVLERIRERREGVHAAEDVRRELGLEN